MSNMTPSMETNDENKSLLDQIIDRQEREATEQFIAEHNARAAERDKAHPERMCQWEPCTFILFGQPNETHEEYHKRKGRC
jgi:hypothetical protein